MKMTYDKKYIPFVKKLIAAGGDCVSLDEVGCKQCPFNYTEPCPCVDWSNEETVHACQEYLKQIETYCPPTCKHCKYWNADEGCDKIKVGIDNFDEGSINLVIDENGPQEELYTATSTPVMHMVGGRPEGIEYDDVHICDQGTFAELVAKYVKVMVGEDFTCPFHEFDQRVLDCADKLKIDVTAEAEISKEAIRKMADADKQAKIEKAKATLAKLEVK